MVIIGSFSFLAKPSLNDPFNQSPMIKVQLFNPNHYSLISCWFFIVTPKKTHIHFDKNRAKKQKFFFSTPKPEDKKVKDLVKMLASHPEKEIELSKEELTLLFKYGSTQNEIQKNLPVLTWRVY